jgi:hypothetical protein
MNIATDILFTCAAAAERPWLERLWPADTAGAELTAVRIALAGVGRRLNGLALPAAEAARLARELAVPAAGWDLGVTGRVALLLTATQLQPRAQQFAYLRQLFLRGDAHEQAAVLRSLILLPDPARFVDLAVEACRTNVIDVFAAIACENAFPARHLPEPNFNQMVLKAIFLGLDTGRIVGLRSRATADLKRMVGDFASERRAAGRTVPADTERILAMEAT